MFTGPLPDLLAGALAWLAAQPPAQAIPPGVLQEVLVNALIHRDWIQSAPLRVTVTATQVRVVSPGPWAVVIRDPEVIPVALGPPQRAPILVDLWRTALSGPIPDLGLGLRLIQAALAAAGLPAAIWRAPAQAVMVQLGTQRFSEAPPPNRVVAPGVPASRLRTRNLNSTIHRQKEKPPCARLRPIPLRTRPPAPRPGRP